MLSGIKGLFEGLFTVFKHLFKRPVTLEYPEKNVNLMIISEESLL